MPSYTLDLDRRADALIELLGCPVRWSSKYYITTLCKRLMAVCTERGRPDLASRIESKMKNTKGLDES